MPVCKCGIRWKPGWPEHATCNHCGTNISGVETIWEELPSDCPKNKCEHGEQPCVHWSGVCLL